MSVIDDINTLGDRATAAVESADYATARQLGTAMLLKLAIVPDGEKEGDAGAKLNWDRNALNDFIDQVKQLAKEASTATGGLAVSQVQYTRQCGGTYE